MRRVAEHQGHGGVIATVALRPMRADDAPAIAALSAQLGYPASADDIRRRFEGIAGQPDSQVFVAQAEDGEVLGWVHVYVQRLLESDGEAEIGGLVVSEQARGRGIGRALMAAAEAWAQERGCGMVRVRSNVIRADAHAFYERIGYAYLKTQKNFRKRL